MSEHVPINAPPAPAPPLRPGDPAPWFIARADNTPRFQFATLGGRRIILSFVRSLKAGDAAAIADALLVAAKSFPPFVNALVLATQDHADADATLPEGLAGARILHDDGAIAALYGADVGPEGPPATTFLIDERVRVFGVITARAPADHVAAALLGLEPARAIEPPRRGFAQAPVLLIPGVFEKALCEELMAGHRSNGGFKSGFMVERDGKTVLATDPGHKIRTDWVVSDARLAAACQKRIQRRVVPEIQRAYQFGVTRIERLLVACYDSADSGHFAQHRDNTTKGTAHRRFAVSVNLNGDYEGGELMFPEFGQTRFRPPPGGACVFSCSLLHKATPVASGRRYVFVPFLYDDAARVIREQNLRFLADKDAADREISMEN